MSLRGGPNAVPVCQDVFDGIEAVRDSGLVNMFDYAAVLELMAFQSDDGVMWMKRNKALYVHGIFNGFKVEDWAHG